jgi:hypothetical protein
MPPIKYLPFRNGNWFITRKTVRSGLNWKLQALGMGLWPVRLGILPFSMFGKLYVAASTKKSRSVQAYYIYIYLTVGKSYAIQTIFKFNFLLYCIYISSYIILAVDIGIKPLNASTPAVHTPNPKINEYYSAPIQRLQYCGLRSIFVGITL